MQEWGIELTDRGISSTKNLYVVSSRQGVKPRPNAPCLAILIPSRGTVPVEILLAWQRIALPINCIVSFSYTRGMSGTQAREELTERAIQSGANFVYYADDDVLPPINVLYKMMLEMQKDETIGLITAVYTTKSDPPHPHLYKEPNGTHYWNFSMDPYDDPETIWGCGAGAMMVRVDAIRKMERPYWAEAVDSRSKGFSVLGHDLHFCEKIRNAGYRTVVDGSLICGHVDEYGKVFSLPLNCPPLSRFRRNPNNEGYWNKVWGVETGGNERFYAELYPEIEDMIEPNCKYVDIGGGTGVLAQWMINKKRVNERVYDFSTTAVDYMLGRGLNASKIKIEEMTSEHLHGADYITCIEVLEHLEEETRQHVLQLMSRSGANCIIAVPLAGKVDTAEHVKDFTEGSLKELLKSHGFHDGALKIIGGRYILVKCKGKGIAIESTHSDGSSELGAVLGTDDGSLDSSNSERRRTGSD